MKASRRLTLAEGRRLRHWREPARQGSRVGFGTRANTKRSRVMHLVMGLLLLASATRGWAQVGFRQLKSFGLQEFSTGNSPVGVVVGRDGWLYGATGAGGSNGMGTLYRLNPAGPGHTILKHFEASEGSPRYPQELVQASDGYLYGIGAGGYGAGTILHPNGTGTIFRIATNGADFAVLKAFPEAGDDGGPPTSLMEGKDGVLYGVTYYWGGQGDVGRVFCIGKDGLGYRTLKRFAQAPGEGARPVSVLEGSDGLLYGTTEQGGLGDAGFGNGGTVFRLGKDGSGFQILKHFTNSPTDGALPGRLMEASDGRLYGVTGAGGATGEGTAFTLRKDGSDYRVLRSFSSADGFGNSPSGLTEGLDGKLYGVHQYGGTTDQGCAYSLSKDGLSFEIFPFGAYWPFKGAPNSSLARAPDGSLYGTTCCDGYRDPFDFGSVYVLAGGPGFLFKFDDTGGDGRSPSSPVLVTSNGLLFGTTPNGGRYGQGAAFRLKSDGTGYTILRHYGGVPADPSGGGAFVLGRDGALYCSSGGGGSNGFGTVYCMNQDGSGLTVLRHFRSVTPEPKTPRGLLEGSDGYLYGSAGGGSNDVGTLFRLDKTGGSFQVLRHFRNAEGEAQQPGTLIEGRDGALYGLAGSFGFIGAIFRIEKDGGNYAVLKRFGDVPADGSIPNGLIEGSDGVLYGTTLIGGSNNVGTAFRLMKDGSGYEILRHFTTAGLGGFPAFATGGWPNGVIEAADGSLVGSTELGSPGGILFRMNRDGSEFVALGRFFDGSRPEGRLSEGEAGRYYGVNSAGGSRGWGSIFRFSAPLRSGWRREGMLEVSDDRGYYPWTTGYRDSEVLNLGTSEPGAEFAVVARTGAGFTPVLRRYDLNTGAILTTNVGSAGTCVLVATNTAGGRFVGMQITSLEMFPTGTYEMACYPVIRTPASLEGALTASDPSTTNRTAAVGSGRWYYDDYLLPQVRASDRVTMRVEPASFGPFVEIRLAASDVPERYADGAVLELGGGDFGPARDYLIRVTSSASGALGGYTLHVELTRRAPEVWDFTPAAGLPGTWVTVRGTNFLDGLNPAVTGVRFGEVPAASTEPVDRGAWQELDALVPDGAVTGPIVVETETATNGSANAFVVLAPIGGIRGENGGVSFAVSSASAGVQNVVEAAPSLIPPVQWQAVATNIVAAPGVWRYSNGPLPLFPQRFYRVRRN